MTPIFLFTLIILSVLLISYSFWEAHWLEIKEVDFINRDLPSSYEGFKIVFITDIHYGPFFSLPRLQNLVEKVKVLNPDLIILGGDYVYKSQKYIEPCFEVLKELKAPWGVFGVLGNHDHWENANLTRKSMKNAGIKLLDNQAEWLEKEGERIKIGGVGDFYEDFQNLKPTVQDVVEEDLVILISHNPDFVDEIKSRKIDLVLSGHTHGGQVTVFGLWAPFSPFTYKPKFRTGVIETENTVVMVSNGIGTVFLPLRFFARPQVMIIYLRKE
ncbi:MAG: 3',5'-cyclic adenosine monophosphate phosphodiesterase CpdA [candidate division WS2 bacterium]|nr:3',5'-cyclic adenosine monophosphate phosphodiesterase CpdA [Candidatus Lithacetigena glycinireducens]